VLRRALIIALAVVVGGMGITTDGDHDDGDGDHDDHDGDHALDMLLRWLTCREVLL
jgi:hypothetical protein